MKLQSKSGRTNWGNDNYCLQKLFNMGSVNGKVTDTNPHEVKMDDKY